GASGAPLAVVVARAVAPVLGGALRVGEHEARRMAAPAKRATAEPPTAYARRPCGQPMRSPLSGGGLLPDAAKNLSGRIISEGVRSRQERYFSVPATTAGAERR